jgi:GNAT superfamily N-acetyltransferase
MVPTSHLLAFAGVAAILIAIPGPSVLFTVSRALTAGRGVALLNVLGNAAGLVANGATGAPIPTAGGGIVVRPFEPGDRAAVLVLSQRLTIGVAVWRDQERVSEAAHGWVEASLATADKPDHAVFVAVAGGSDGEVVGFVSVGESKHFTGQVDGYVGELVTAAAAEGRGVGRALMAAAEDWARQRGLSNLTLETGAANGRARNFYANLGYLEEEVRLTRRLSS